MTLRNSYLGASQKELTKDVTKYLLIVLISPAIPEDFSIKPFTYGQPLNANFE
jgi:hypothetical protein